MTSPFRLTLPALIVAGVSLLSTTSFAATTMVKVVETGEGGGTMGLTLEPATVKPGAAVFSVHNDAVGEEHEMIVVRLKSPDQAIPVVKAKNRVDESKLKSLGEVADLKPGADGQLKTTLKAGTYLVFCNIKGHYAAGMAAKLTVKP